MDNFITIWNDEHQNYVLIREADIPSGYAGRSCPKCGNTRLVGAVIGVSPTEQAIEGSDSSDPNILCRACGYWADAFNPGE